jgi:hypothetical protein
MRPPTGLIYWRTKGTLKYHLGYVTESGIDYNHVRIGRYAGHTMNAPIVNSAEIDWLPYRDHLVR